VAVIGMEAFRIPAPWGVNDTVIVHWPPGSDDLVQVVAAAKSAGFGEVGEIAMEESVMGLSPLVMVTTWDWLVVPRL
jgi:hypothetical protein